MNLPQPDPAFRWTTEAWGPALRCVPLGRVAQHLFTSRQLELPSPASWAQALAAVGATSDRLRRVRQVHGSSVRILGRGARSELASEERPDGDALISNDPGLVLAVLVADCVPILMADRTSGAAAAVHAGWRGTCARVGPVAIERMQREFGTKPANLTVAIGPSIGPDDYEVGDGLVDEFVTAGHLKQEIDRWFIRGRARPHLDLWSANRDQLAGAGVDPNQIYTCGLSTLRHTDVFASYRADADRAGRMAAMIEVPV